MDRDDLSNKLIHLTSRTETSSAFDNFYNIIKTEKLMGSSKMIKGGFNCICFSEAPISKLGIILSRQNAKKIKYSPFGLMFDKKYLFDLGARPAIYQPDEEFSQLTLQNQYRHVRFEPSNEIDWTWEREWRYKTDELTLEPNLVTLIVPTREVVEQVKEEYNNMNQLYSTLGTAGMLGITSLRWHFLVLEDLGIKM